MTDAAMLYRSLGPKELEHIEASGWPEFPNPGSPGSRFLYPVTNEAYAVQIAREILISKGRGLARSALRRQLLHHAQARQPG